MTASIAEILKHHDERHTPDDYCPSVNLGELKALVKAREMLRAEREHLYTALEATLETHNDTCIEGAQQPPLPEDYPVRMLGPWRHARPFGGEVSMTGVPSSVTDDMVMPGDAVARRVDRRFLSAAETIEKFPGIDDDDMDYPRPMGVSRAAREDNMAQCGLFGPDDPRFVSDLSHRDVPITLTPAAGPGTWFGVHPRAIDRFRLRDVAVSHPLRTAIAYGLILLITAAIFASAIRLTAIRLTP